MNSENRMSNKNGKINNKNIFVRMMEWIARGAEKAEKSGGGCTS